MAFLDGARDRYDPELPDVRTAVATGRRRNPAWAPGALAALMFGSAWVSWGGALMPPIAAAAASGCTVQLASPVLVPIGTVPGGVVIDDACQYVYLTNPIENRIEVFSLETLTLEEPIQVGAQPVGLDITSAGDLLYVANSGGNNLSVVSLARRVEVRKIRFPASPQTNDRPYSLVIANNGKAYFTTTFGGSGFGGRVMQLDLATDQFTHRTDAPSYGSTTQQTYVRASHDRATIAFAMLGIYSGRLVVFRTATDTFSPSLSVSPYVADVGVDMTGSKFLVTPGSYVLDSSLNQIGTIAGGTGSRGTVVDASGGIGYRCLASKVEILNLSTFLIIGEITLGDSVTGGTPYGTAGQMDLSSDGKLLAVTTSTGFVLVQVPGQGPPPVADGSKALR